MAKQKEERVKNLTHFEFLIEAMLRVEHLRISAQTRDTHLQKRGRQDPFTVDILGKLRELEHYIDKIVAGEIEDHSAYPWFSQIKGIGRENIAKVVGLIDIYKAPYPSSLVKWAGYAPGADGKAMRKKRGQKIEYNAELRPLCYRLGGSLMKARGSYYDYYLDCKAAYVKRFTEDEGKEIVPKDKLPRKKNERGKWVHYETDELISEGHVHLMALRKTIKLFLHHLWYEWRKAEGLPTASPWIIEHGGHRHIITSEEMIDKAKTAKKKARKAQPA